MAKFYIGEIAVGQNFVDSTRRNGQECEVFEGPKIRLIKTINEIPCEPFADTKETYAVMFADGSIRAVTEDKLRKKHRSRNYWNDLEKVAKWNPTKKVNNRA